MQTAALWEIGLTNVYRSRAGTASTPPWYRGAVKREKILPRDPRGCREKMADRARRSGGTANSERDLYLLFVYLFPFSKLFF